MCLYPAYLHGTLILHTAPEIADEMFDCPASPTTDDLLTCILSLI